MDKTTKTLNIDNKEYQVCFDVFNEGDILLYRLIKAPFPFIEPKQNELIHPDKLHCHYVRNEYGGIIFNSIEIFEESIENKKYTTDIDCDNAFTHFTSIFDKSLGEELRINLMERVEFLLKKHGVYQFVIDRLVEIGITENIDLEETLKLVKDKNCITIISIIEFLKINKKILLQ